MEDIGDGNASIRFAFESPWSPPEELYENIQSGKYGDGYTVNAQWFEEGMCFIGWYQDGAAETYEYDGLESLDDIPEELVENWGIRDMLEDRAEWEEEDE